MANVIRAALVQTDWTGDKESMIKAHEEYAREAAAQGAQVICFQELFYGPYFCQVQDAAVLRVRRVHPGGPTTERFQALAKELGMVMVLPMYEEEQPGVSTTPPPWSTPTAATSASTASTTSRR